MRDGDALTSARCRTLVRQLTRTYPRTFVVLDALDECEETATGVGNLLEFLGELDSDPSIAVNIFLSSRPSQYVKQHFAPRSWPNKTVEPSHMTIEASDNRQDIKLYVEKRLSKGGLPEVLDDPDVRRKIESTLETKSAGM